jgi:hypothetical protein
MTYKESKPRTHFTLEEIIAKLVELEKTGNFYGETTQKWQNGKIILWIKETTEKPGSTAALHS